MACNLKFFRNIISNIIIAVVVVGVLAFTISNVSISASTDVSPIYKGDSTKNVSLMINVYWGTEFLDEMLEILNKNGCKTTFFIGGTWAAQNESMLKKIYESGHEIANHGYYHKDHKKLSNERNREEINVTHQVIKNILGIDMNLFAPPSGSFSKTTLSVAKDLGYQTIMWSRDTIDWRDHDVSLIRTRASKNIKAGELVLMHPTRSTVDALDGIIKDIKVAGLNIDTVTNTLIDK